MQKLSALILLLALAGCAAGQMDDKGQPAALLSQVPMESATFAAEYQRLAECVYKRLDNPSGGGLRKVDLPNERTSSLALESGNFRQWELIFEGVDATHTRVRFSKVQTMWGPLGGNQAMPAVRSCAGL